MQSLDICFACHYLRMQSWGMIYLWSTDNCTTKFNALGHTRNVVNPDHLNHLYLCNTIFRMKIGHRSFRVNDGQCNECMFCLTTFYNHANTCFRGKTTLPLLFVLNMYGGVNIKYLEKDTKMNIEWALACQYIILVRKMVRWRECGRGGGGVLHSPGTPSKLN